MRALRAWHRQEVEQEREAMCAPCVRSTMPVQRPPPSAQCARVCADDGCLPPHASSQAFVQLTDFVCELLPELDPRLMGAHALALLAELSAASMER